MRIPLAAAGKGAVPVSDLWGSYVLERVVTG
jgi:hypothetical protein